jgi:perosamine synthetase
MVMDYVEWPQPDKIVTPLATPSLSNFEKKALLDVFESGWIGSNSPYVLDTEDSFSSFFNSKSLLVSNGSVALMLALRSLGIKSGDEVIVPALTYAATASSVCNVGATPVFCDVEIDSWQISVESMLSAVTTKTKAVIVPHLYGFPADIDRVMSALQGRGVFIIEDAAEAFAAKYKNRLVGTLGDVGTFSFFPNKLITSGEGGLCVTSSEKNYDHMKSLRGQGMNSQHRYFFDEPGYNFRMTGLQAAILGVQLNRFAFLFQAREVSQNTYRKILPKNCIEPSGNYDFTSSPWIFSCRLEGLSFEKKIALATTLATIGIETRPVFYPLPLMRAFCRFRSTEIPNSRIIADEGISLPTGEHVSELTYIKISDAIRKIYA